MAGREKLYIWETTGLSPSCSILKGQPVPVVVLHHSKDPWKGPREQQQQGFHAVQKEKTKSSAEKGSSVLSDAQGAPQEHTDLAAQQLCKIKTQGQHCRQTSLISPPRPYKHPPACEGYYNLPCCYIVLLSMFQNREHKAQFPCVGFNVSNWGQSFISGSICFIYLLFQIRFKSFVFSFKDTKQAA